jgi:hypothetical protein
VFSRPAKLREWLEGEGLTIESRQHLITDAGQLIPEFALSAQEVEFFVHSPFGKRLNEVEVIDRNIDSLVVQATFTVNGVATRVLLGSDLEYMAISDIVDVTRAKKRDERLESDVIKLWHHCSYTAIGPEKGAEKTEPVEQVKWIFEEKLPQNAIIVSTSKPIPSDDEDDQPPHRQAAAYYKDCLAAVGGEFKVTMEHPVGAPQKYWITKPFFLRQQTGPNGYLAERLDNLMNLLASDPTNPSPNPLVAELQAQVDDWRKNLC